MGHVQQRTTRGERRRYVAKPGLDGHQDVVHIWSWRGEPESINTWVLCHFERFRHVWLEMLLGNRSPEIITEEIYHYTGDTRLSTRFVEVSFTQLICNYDMWWILRFDRPEYMLWVFVIWHYYGIVGEIMSKSYE